MEQAFVFGRGIGQVNISHEKRDRGRSRSVDVGFRKCDECGRVDNGKERIRERHLGGGPHVHLFSFHELELACNELVCLPVPACVRLRAAG